MKYLSNAVRFTLKNWMLIIPLFVLMAFANLFKSSASAMTLTTYTSLADLDNLRSAEAVFSLIPKILTAAIGGGIIAFLIPFIYQPATYGLVNKGLETGSSSLNDIGAAISSNFVKYVMYFLGTVVVFLALSIAGLILFLLLALLVAALKGIGAVLMFIAGLAVFVFIIAFSALISLWFTAMVVDGFDVLSAFKKSIDIVKGCFWTVFGITLLVGIIAAAAGGILGLIFGGIPVLGSIITSTVPAVSAFIMIVFSLMIYREKTGRTSA